MKYSLIVVWFLEEEEKAMVGLSHVQSLETTHTRSKICAHPKKYAFLAL